jgi:GDP-L-fucose synthase
MLKKDSKIFIAGHKGMVGSAIERLLIKEGFTNLITRSRQELNLLDSNSVKQFFDEIKPEYVILSAAKVGGIKANMAQPVEFLNENLNIQNNIINESFRTNVKKFIFLGSSCIYPRDCPQPMKEDYLLTGKLEPTNEGYALAKIVGLKLLEYYYKQYGFNSISLMPCNLYGTNDSFNPEHSHVLSALVRKFVDAVDNNTSLIEIWGTGVARREFMHVDDLASGVLYLMNNYDSPEFINIGWGIDISIKELALLIAQQAGYKGEIKWDTTKPDGMPVKCMDISKIQKLGFQPLINLEAGIAKTIEEYKNLKAKGKV